MSPAGPTPAGADNSRVTEVDRTPKVYLKYALVASEKRHLLVEGPSDRDLLRRLFELVDPNYKRYVQIDVAERIKPDVDHPAGTSFGARDRVERVCELARDWPDADRFLGFVDREYHDFRFDPTIHDDAPDHRIDGRLVRARGHSMENYLFDFAAFGERIREYVSDGVPATVDMFRRVFPDAIRIACGIGLACLNHPDQNLSQKIQNSPAGWRSLVIGAEGRLRLDTDLWRDHLSSGVRLKTNWVHQLLGEYDAFRDRVFDADFSVVRWLCHGHIGLSVIWATIARCVFDSSDQPEAEREGLAKAALEARRDHRLRAIIDAWAAHALDGSLDCPRMLFELLGLRLPAARS